MKKKFLYNNLGMQLYIYSRYICQGNLDRLRSRITSSSLICLSSISKLLKSYEALVDTLTLNCKQNVKLKAMVTNYFSQVDFLHQIQRSK